jgi:hypothetical protein
MYISVSQEQGGTQKRRTCLIGKGSDFGVTELFWKYLEVGITQQCGYTKSH